MWIWGRAPSGSSACRTAWTQARSRPWESRSPTWQVAPPMQHTEVSKLVRAPSRVASSTWAASRPVRLTI